VTPREALLQATTERMHHVITAYTRYQNALKENNALDFDDLILETVRLFQEIPETLDRYQETWRALHVDEYQDTNTHSTSSSRSSRRSTATSASSATPTNPSTPSGRGHPQHPRVRERISGCSPHQARAELPLDADHSDRVERRHRRESNRPEKEMWTERKEGQNVIIHEVRDEKRKRKRLCGLRKRCALMVYASTIK